jgi:hypothetical protein
MPKSSYDEGHNVLYISHTASEHCSLIFGEQPLNRWKYRINVSISGIKNRVPFLFLVTIWHFYKYWCKPKFNGTEGNLDVYTYTAHSEGPKNHYAHGILSLYWLNWCCSSQTYQTYVKGCTSLKPLAAIGYLCWVVSNFCGYLFLMTSTIYGFHLWVPSAYDLYASW